MVAHVLPLEVEDFLTWLASEKGRATTTLNAYRRDITTFVGWLTKHELSLSEADTKDLAKYIAFLRDKGRAPATVARATVAVRSLYRFLAIEGVLPEDPTAALDVPKVPKGLPRALNESQIEALLASPLGVSPLAKRDRAILEVLYGGGLRISELVGLSLGDIDIDASLMRVLGKGSRERIVPIGRLALAALIDWLGSSGRAVLSPETWASREAETAVFLNARGGRLSRQGAWLVVRSHGDNVGLGPELTPHVLRHSCATHMLNHGADIRTVQELLGHISITSTQRYTLVSQQVLRDVYDSAHPRAQL